MHQSYRFAIIYFVLFGVLLLVSGALLFLTKMGLSVEGVQSFYLGSAVHFAQPKTPYGLLETALPHLGAMGLFIFVLGHFMLFGTKQEKRQSILPVKLLFVAALVDIGSGFMIIEGWHLFVTLKIIAFLTLQLTAFYLLFLLFRSTLRSITKQRRR